MTVNKWIVGRDRAHRRRGHAGARSLSLQRRGGRALSFRLGRVLRLVSRIHQAGAERQRRSAKARDARHRRLGARPHPAACCIPSCRSSPRNCGRGWPSTRCRARSMLMLSPWPDLSGLPPHDDGARRNELADRPRLRRARVRAEMNVPPSAKHRAAAEGRERGDRARGSQRHRDVVMTLARLSSARASRGDSAKARRSSCSARRWPLFLWAMSSISTRSARGSRRN